MFKEVATAHTCAQMPAPAWEGIATQLAFVNHPHMEAFVPILLGTYTRPSELLALRRKDRVPPLVPLLP